jgi:hypothetical protein
MVRRTFDRLFPWEPAVSHAALLRPARPPAPVSFRGLTIFSRNGFCVYSSASVSPAAPPDPGFMWTAIGPERSAREFLVSVDRRRAQ